MVMVRVTYYHHIETVFVSLQVVGIVWDKLREDDLGKYLRKI